MALQIHSCERRFRQVLNTLNDVNYDLITDQLKMSDGWIRHDVLVYATQVITFEYQIAIQSANSTKSRNQIEETNEWQNQTQMNY